VVRLLIRICDLHFVSRWISRYFGDVQKRGVVISHFNFIVLKSLAICLENTSVLVDFITHEAVVVKIGVISLSNSYLDFFRLLFGFEPKE